MNYVAPGYNLEAFNCPFCNAYAHMKWQRLSRCNVYTDVIEAICSRCSKANLWTIPDPYESPSAKLIYPDYSFVEPPEEDMPENVKKEYIEAASIFSKSPKGAAALLRLGLQKLFVHLGEGGKDINKDIRSLAQKQTLPQLIINVADTVRLTGNNAVHPGEMNEEDIDYVASKMFSLLNIIVNKGISEPKELKALYELTPESKREYAEKTDSKNKKSN